MRTSEIYLKAACVLKDRGLFKGWFYNTAGGLCAMGAVRVAERGDASIPCSGRLWLPLDEITGGDVLKWNDAPDRTAGEVIAALDAAAVVALQEEGLEPEDVL